MIVEVKEPYKYGKYFLSQEAPGDEEPEAPKRNTKIIEIKAKNRLKNDFTDGAEEEEPSEEVEPTDNEEDLMNEPEMDNLEDYTSNEPIIQNQSETGLNIEDDVNATNAEIDTNNNIDFTEDDVEVNTDVTNQNDGMNDDTGPDLGNGEEDFTSNNIDSEEPNDGNNTDDGTGEQKGPGLEYDSTRKYVLFVNFSDLLVAIDNYISKLESTTNDDVNFNVTIKIVTEKLREIRMLCYDYMTMKFEISSYIQSLLFYQNIIVLIQLSFNLLDKVVKSIKTKE